MKKLLSPLTWVASFLMLGCMAGVLLPLTACGRGEVCAELPILLFLLIFYILLPAVSVMFVGCSIYKIFFTRQVKDETSEWK